MPFDPNVPVATQSPGLFPPQNSTNYAQLKKIIIADHVFNDSPQDTDGFHKQVSMIVRAAPSHPLPTGVNAILYSKLDSLSQAQLWYDNGVVDQQITPFSLLHPIRVVGLQNSVAANTTITAFANPGYTWCGTGWAMITSTATFSFYNLLRVVDGNDFHEIDSNQGGGDPAKPTFSFSGSDLKITNNSSGTANLKWSLIINRLS